MLGWLGVAVLWMLGVTLFVGFSVAVLWIAGRLLPLAGRGRRRG